MPISVQCDCGSEILADDNDRGLSIVCPNCGATQVADGELVRVARIEPKRVDSNIRYWLLLPALIPLVIPVFTREIDGINDYKERIKETLRRMMPEDREQAVRHMKDGLPANEAFFNYLPDDRIMGAYLPRESDAPMIFAGLAVAVSLLVIGIFIPPEVARQSTLLRIGFVTGTVGILFLLCTRILLIMSPFGAFVFVSELGSVLGAGTLIGFLLTLLGEVLITGLFEEVFKGLAIFNQFRRTAGYGWRIACALGMASGLGFGITEAIHYSGYYNGLSSGNIYLIRFVSCVSLHGIWTATTGVMLWQRRFSFCRAEGAAKKIPEVLRIVAPQALLHGFYNALLEHELAHLAAFVAVFSFAWLGWQIENSKEMELDEAIAQRDAMFVTSPAP